jgi:hypothetical protein
MKKKVFIERNIYKTDLYSVLREMIYTTNSIQNEPDLIKTKNVLERALKAEHISRDSLTRSSYCNRKSIF